MAFSEGISRLQRIIEFISIDYRSKKEIMAYLRNFNSIISYKTLERDLKQINEELEIVIEYRRNLGYRCENKNFLLTSSTSIEKKEMKVGFENDILIIVNIFEYAGITYCNCLDKITKKIFTIVT
jgi:hypothetical protein